MYMNRMKKNLVIFFGLLLIASTNVWAQKKSLDNIAAVVGGAIILKSDLEMQYAQYLAQGNADNSEVRCYFLQQLLTQKLLSQQAVIDSVTVTEDQVDDEIDRRLRSMTSRAGGQEKLEQFLNRSVIQYKDEIRPDIREQLVANKMQGKITEGISVTTSVVRTYFEAILKDSLPY